MPGIYFRAHQTAFEVGTVMTDAEKIGRGYACLFTTGSIIEEFSDGGWPYILTENELISYGTARPGVHILLRSDLKFGLSEHVLTTTARVSPEYLLSGLSVRHTEYHPTWRRPTPDGYNLCIGCREFTPEHTKLLLKWGGVE
jgi:hypothetical protein